LQSLNSVKGSFIIAIIAIVVTCLPLIIRSFIKAIARAIIIIIIKRAIIIIVRVAISRALIIPGGFIPVIIIIFFYRAISFVFKTIIAYIIVLSLVFALLIYSSVIAIVE